MLKFLIFGFFAQISGFSAETQCEATARTVGASGIKQCKSIVTKKYAGSEAVKDLRQNIKEFELKRKDLREKMCEKALVTYEPNGLIAEIPPNWSCPKEPYIQHVLQKLCDQSMFENIDTSKDAYNIVLVGRTGSGKSYFGNVLLGSLDPASKENVPFPSSGSAKSVTQNVYAQTGFLFGGLYDKELGLRKPLKVNIFDTPGFADVDIDNIRKNKLLIASSLKNDIHMIIFLTANSRFDSDNQHSLKELNEWTAGKMWKNLVVVKGRTLFDKYTVTQRFENNVKSSTLKNNRNIVDLLWKRGKTDRWEEKLLVKNQLVIRGIERKFLKNIKISLLNPAQHRECLTDRDHQDDENNEDHPDQTSASQRTKDCWILPKFDDRKKYVTDELNNLVFSEKIAFIEEATQFVKMLKQMKRRPIIPSAKLFGVELAQDIKIFNDLLAEENNIDISAATKASNKTELLDALLKCENVEIDVSHCPEWKEWMEWSKCGECGVQSKKRIRSGCVAQGNIIDIKVCERSFGRPSYEMEICEGLQPCEDNALYMEQIQLQQKNYATQQTDMMTKMISKMTEKANGDKTMMMTMFKQMNDNTLMIMSKMQTKQEEKNGFSQMMTNTVRKIIGFFTGGQKPQPASITPVLKEPDFDDSATSECISEEYPYDYDC